MSELALGWIERQLAGPYDELGNVLLVQFSRTGQYVVAGQSLDTDLR